MSSNQNNAQSRKVSSISRRLNSRIFLKKLSVALGGDLLLFLVCLLLFGISSEMAVNDHKPFSAYSRVYISDDNIVEEFVRDGGKGYWANMRLLLDNYELANKLVKYKVTDRSGLVLYEIPSFWPFLYMVTGCIGLFLLQLILDFIGLIFEYWKIKKIMSPIAEIAVRADELSRLEFDESKYHLLEEKITSLRPEESLSVTHGDKELESIETAINNLLLRMRESNMRQARFVNDASHELRTPIAVIEGYSNMLARWGREDEKVLDESITAIQHESAHMKYLVEQLLFLARGDSGKTVLHPENIALNDMMREIYEESLMIDENHVYRFVSPEEQIMAECDPALLKQAVRILVDNAAKYTKEHDEIIISLGHNEENRPYLQVQDSGIGMAEADVAHMFERFYRADEARSYKGTGLGLSIAKWIVDKHRGRFEVISRTDLGSRIRIIL